MNDLVVDPMLFRVRCMEKDWSRMLEGLLFAHSRGSTAHARRYGALIRILAQEGNLWFLVGSELGYFGGVDSLALLFEELDFLELDHEAFQLEVLSYFNPFRQFRRDLQSVRVR